MNAAEKVWVCEKGHVDDHHVDLRHQHVDPACSRCGGKCEEMAVDRLAREYVERLRVNVGLVAENTALKKKLREGGDGTGAGNPRGPSVRGKKNQREQSSSEEAGCSPAASVDSVTSLNKLLSAIKVWRNATESRLRLLNGREALDTMIPADRALIEAAKEIEAEQGAEGEEQVETVWLCAKCGYGSEEHGMAGHRAYECTADMRLVPAAFYRSTQPSAETTTNPGGEDG